MTRLAHTTAVALMLSFSGLGGAHAVTPVNPVAKIPVALNAFKVTPVPSAGSTTTTAIAAPIVPSTLKPPAVSVTPIVTSTLKPLVTSATPNATASILTGTTSPLTVSVSSNATTASTAATTALPSQQALVQANQAQIVSAQLSQSNNVTTQSLASTNASLNQTTAIQAQILSSLQNAQLQSQGVNTGLQAEIAAAQAAKGQAAQKGATGITEILVQ